MLTSPRACARSLRFASTSHGAASLRRAIGTRWAAAVGVAAIVVACSGSPALAPDAAALADAGAVSDAGALLDAGEPDAGSMADGGADAGVDVDAGAADAGVDVDAGAVVDAGTLVDAGASDGGPLVDGGLADGGAADGGEADAGAASDAGVGELADCPSYPGDGDEDDYTPIEHLRDDALRAALLARIDGHNSLGYEDAKVALFGDGGVDVHGGSVECMYTARTFMPSQLDRSGGYNVEHTWPQSQGASDSVPRSDLHHLFPVERNWNSARGTLPFGQTDCLTSACRRAEGGSEIGPRIGGLATEFVMEVRPDRRGDIARAKFYFAVRYTMSIPPHEEEALRRWNRCDPPDALEHDRNDAIEVLQGNRNPFVDRPQFVDAIGTF